MNLHIPQPVSTNSVLNNLDRTPSLISVSAQIIPAAGESSVQQFYSSPSESLVPLPSVVIESMGSGLSEEVVLPSGGYQSASSDDVQDQGIGGWPDAATSKE